MAVNIDIG